MVEKFFLGLDYDSHSKAEAVAEQALNFIEKQYGRNFVNSKMGLKVNQDLFTGFIPEGAFAELSAKLNCLDYKMFADMKIAHGYDTGRRIIQNLNEVVPIDYVTVSAGLGRTMLKEYVKIGKEFGTKIIAFTDHTKIPEDEIVEMSNQSLMESISVKTRMASDAGCDAAVMEASMLKHPRIAQLPIKKLVTGIRIDPSDRGTQKRVSSLEDVASVKPLADYVVISSRYLENEAALKQYIDALL
jgi:orotidine-5'-phosphate decarboxylase